MNTYLTIMVTVLVATQIIRITQNHISLFRQEKRIKEDLAWIKDTDIKKRDFEIQREVYMMLHNKLTAEAQAKLGTEDGE